jgi:hypothetical protein
MVHAGDNSAVAQLDMLRVRPAHRGGLVRPAGHVCGAVATVSPIWSRPVGAASRSMRVTTAVICGAGGQFAVAQLACVLSCEREVHVAVYAGEAAAEFSKGMTEFSIHCLAKARCSD